MPELFVRMIVVAGILPASISNGAAPARDRPLRRPDLLVPSPSRGVLEASPRADLLISPRVFAELRNSRRSMLTAQSNNGRQIVLILL